MDNQDSSVYDNLVKKIVKAVPEIHEDADGDFKAGVFSLLDYIGGLSSVNRKEPWSIMDTLDKICEARIRCRPITLEDVLRAMKSNQNRYFLVDRHGNMECGNRILASDNPKSQWFLGKPLSDQSLETQLFLNSIL